MEEKEYGAEWGRCQLNEELSNIKKTRLPKLHEFTNNLIIIILADVKLTNPQKQARVADAVVKKDV